MAEALIRLKRTGSEGRVRIGSVLRVRWILPLLAALLLGLALFIKGQYVPPVLMYHAIEREAQESRWVFDPESFDHQVRFLVSQNYNIITLDVLADYLEHRIPLPPKPVVLTFDDGLDSVYYKAFPLLRQRNLPAAFFVTTSLVGSPGYVTWEQLHEMQESGITIGSHCVTHRRLAGCSEAVLRHEMVESKAELERRLGRTVKHVAYPYGAFDSQVQKIAREAGYRTACATNPGFHAPNDDSFAIKRINISRKSMSHKLPVFQIHCSGYYTPIKEYLDLLWAFRSS